MTVAAKSAPKNLRDDAILLPLLPDSGKRVLGKGAGSRESNAAGESSEGSIGRGGSRPRADAAVGVDGADQLPLPFPISLPMLTLLVVVLVLWLSPPLPLPVVADANSPVATKPTVSDDAPWSSECSAASEGEPFMSRGAAKSRAVVLDSDGDGLGTGQNGAKGTPEETATGDEEGAGAWLPAG